MPTPISARTPLPTASALDRVRPLHEVHIWQLATGGSTHLSGGCPWQPRLNRRPDARIGCAAGRGAGDGGGVLGAIGDGGHWREGHVVMYNVLVSL